MNDPIFGSDHGAGPDIGSLRADFRLGEWTVRPSLDQIERDGVVVRLQHLSMRVLCYLSERSGAVVGYDELLEALWPGRVAGEDAVHRRVADLRQQLGDDARSPQYIETILKQGYRIIAPVLPLAAPPARARSHARRWMPAAGGALTVTLLVLLWLWNLPVTTPPPEIIREAQAALAEEDYERAHGLMAEFIDRYPEHPDVQVIADALLVDIRLETTPVSAQVTVRPYGDAKSAWQALGDTPLRHRLPRGTWQVRLSAPGRETLELALPNPSRAFNNGDRPAWVFDLPEAGTVPDGMVYVPPFDGRIPILGLRRFENLGPFYIDRTEVSNADYQAFVSSGGYADPRYWAALSEAEPPLTMQAVSALFVDETARPGPAGWRDGRYPEGMADHPVSGVSYYEAMAYAEFRGKKLPTARHWARAALGIDEHRWPLASSLIPSARLSGHSTVPVDSPTAISTWGARHLVGNVREWTRDFSGADKLCVGSSYQGPAWHYASPGFSDPLQRTTVQGFRLALYEDNVEPAMVANQGDEPRLPSVSDETYAGIIRQLHYPERTVRARDARQVYEREEHEWLRRKLLLPGELPDDPLPVLLFLPKRAIDPMVPVIFVPPADSYDAGFPSERIDITGYDIDFLVREGMALVWPIYWGSHDRYVNRPEEGTAEQLRMWQLAIDRRRNELGRVIDYLQDEPSFDGDRVGLMAISFGATYLAPPFLAAEKRLKTAMLLATGLATLDPERVPLHLNPNTYWPRITQPLLILSGRYDLGFNSGTSEPSILKALHPAATRNRVILYPTAHWPLPRRLIRRDVLAWLEELSDAELLADQHPAAE